MVSQDNVISIYQYLQSQGILVWLSGGWGVDALLRRQTREHKDLDLFVQLDDVVHLRNLLESTGYKLKEFWSENKMAIDRLGFETPTAFVLLDAEGRELDLHAIQLDAQGNGIPTWESKGIMFTKEDLAGEGCLAGYPIHCLSPNMQVFCHRGYELPDWQKHDLELLHKKYGTGFPDTV